MNNKDPLVPIFQLDLSVPIQSFVIEFSVIKTGGLPFVPEFVLRLLNISNLSIDALAGFFGFNPKEVNLAISSLIDKGDVEYLRDGRVSLTPLSRQYFEENGKEPLFKSLGDFRKRFTFELFDFKYFGVDEKYSDTRNSVLLDVENEKRANSVSYAGRAFQNSFREIYRKGDIIKVEEDSKIPDLYKISDIRKTRDLTARVSVTFLMNIESGVIERKLNSNFPSSESFERTLTEVISSASSRSNLKEISILADYFRDNVTLKALDGDNLDIAYLLTKQFSDRVHKDDVASRIFGSLHLSANWAHVQKTLENCKKRIKIGKNRTPLRFDWLIPSNHTWGQCENIRQSLVNFLDFSAGITTKAGVVPIDSRILFPFESTPDVRDVRKCTKEFKEAENLLNGFVASQADGYVEALCLENNFAIVIYHLALPDWNGSVVPFGFVTEDQTIISLVDSFIQNTISGYTSSLEPKFFGPLKSQISLE